MAASAALPRPAAAVGTPLTAMGWGVDYKYDPNEPVPIEFLPPVLQEVSWLVVNCMFTAS